jgi:hypothetical protein
MSLASTSIPWLIGGFCTVVIITAFQTLRAWREAKRSPFFFMRREAQRRVQQYGTATLLVLSLTVVTAAYSWNPPADDIPRFAVIAQAKPAEPTVNLSDLAAPDDGATASVDRGPAQSSALTTLVGAPLEIAEETVEAFSRRLPQLPATYRDVYDAEVGISASTRMGAVAFTREIDESYAPVDARRFFEPGFYTIYAAFAYEGMKDGMEWAWLWLRNGDPVSGGTELWQHGPEGPGYVYFKPEEGFRSGDYQLQIWVDEQLLTQATMIVTAAAAAR